MPTATIAQGNPYLDFGDEVIRWSAVEQMLLYHLKAGNAADSKRVVYRELTNGTRRTWSGSQADQIRRHWPKVIEAITGGSNGLIHLCNAVLPKDKDEEKPAPAASKATRKNQTTGRRSRAAAA
jgi:hypothetical protein